MEPDQIIVERNKIHGNFNSNSMISQAIKALFGGGILVNVQVPTHWQMLSAIQKEALEMIALKLSRIVTGNPNEPDHWNDIAGYARLVARELESRTDCSQT